MVIDNSNGLLITRSSRPRLRMKLIDGELQPVGPNDKPITKTEPAAIEPSVVAEAIDEVTAPIEHTCDYASIARPMLATNSAAIVAIYSDSKGNLLGSTITRPKHGMTAAAFRSAYRSLPPAAKQVVFVVVGGVASDIRATINEYADIFLCRCIDLITIDPS